MKQKINLRLSFIALIAVIAATVGCTLVYYSLFRMQVQNDLAANARLLADTDLFQNLYAEAGGDSDLIDSGALENLRTDSLRITWIASDGTVLYDNDTDITGLQNHLDRPEIQEALEAGEGFSIRRSATLNMNSYYCALKLQDGTILRVSTQARSITSMFLTAVPVILGVAALVIALCILIGHLLTNILMKPFRDMAEHPDDSLEVPEYRELEPFVEKIRTQHEKILEAAKSRQDFTANISHELKTPLTAISGYAELLENHMVAEDQEPRIAGQIKSNAQRLLSLINDIIRLSELDHTEVSRKLEPVDLYETAAASIDNLKVAADQRSVELKLTGESVMVQGEKELLKELIENLVQNSIRYNRLNGWVHIKVFTEDGHAALSVEDNGIGIPKNQQERVFERFYRVDKSRSRETGGTGLGLAIVKHIVEIHNASIILDSEPDYGTTVTVRF